MPYKALRAFSYMDGGTSKVFRKGREIGQNQFNELPDKYRDLFEEITDVKVLNKPYRTNRNVSHTTKVQEDPNMVQMPTKSIEMTPPFVLSESDINAAAEANKTSYPQQC